MTIELLKPCTDLIWRSPDSGDKTISIPGSIDANNGYSLDIITTLGTGETFTVVPTSGTIDGQPSFSFTDIPCTLMLRSDAENTEWIVRCLCCVESAET